MRIALMLVILAFIALPTAKAAPINNSTEPVPEVHTVTEVVQATPSSVETIQSVAPTPEPQTPVEPEQPPEPIKETVAHPIGCENYRQLINQYDWNVDVALQVMRAESGCNPSAVGDNRVIGGIFAPSCGLFQVRTLQGRPSCEQLQNPATNIEWAFKLYRASGWKPWSVCNIGKVSCY